MGGGAFKRSIILDSFGMAIKLASTITSRDFVALAIQFIGSISRIRSQIGLDSRSGLVGISLELRGIGLDNRLHRNWTRLEVKRVLPQGAPNRRDRQNLTIRLPNPEGDPQRTIEKGPAKNPTSTVPRVYPTAICFFSFLRKRRNGPSGHP
jgi:hypothetical protein